MSGTKDGRHVSTSVSHSSDSSSFIFATSGRSVSTPRRQRTCEQSAEWFIITGLKARPHLLLSRGEMPSSRKRRNVYVVSTYKLQPFPARSFPGMHPFDVPVITTAYQFDGWSGDTLSPPLDLLCGLCRFSPPVGIIRRFV